MNKLINTIEFLVFYLKEVISSNVVVAINVLRPSPQIIPGIVEVPVADLTDRQLFALSNLITMTPGTLSLEVSPDRKTLSVHAMFASDPQAIEDDLTNQMKERVIRVF
ncbi:MAG: Na+/H+ antiporter subunit E [Verrucomicrobiota bacterium]